jgi:hypothetical protein
MDDEAWPRIKDWIRTSETGARSDGILALKEALA